MKALQYLTLCAGLALTGCAEELTGKGDVQQKLPIITEQDLGAFSQEVPARRRIAMVYYPEHKMYMRYIVPEDKLQDLRSASREEYNSILKERSNDRGFLEKERRFIEDNLQEVKNYLQEQLPK